MTNVTLYCIIVLENVCIFQKDGSKGRKLDARVIKTKQKLFSTFKEMIAEMPFENITVNDICKRADVRRATFYKHFDDKYSFLRFFISSLRTDFDKLIWKKKKPDATPSYYVAYLKSLVKFLVENEKIVNMVLNSELIYVIIELVKEQNYIDTRDRIQQSVDEGMKLPASVETVASMMAGAVTNAVYTWFKNGKPIPENQFIKEVSTLVRMFTGNLEDEKS